MAGRNQKRKPKSGPKGSGSATGPSRPPKKRYYRLSEVANDWSAGGSGVSCDEKSLVHYAANGELEVWIVAQDWNLTVGEGLVDGSVCTDWISTGPTNVFTGLLRLLPSDLRTLDLAGEASVELVPLEPGDGLRQIGFVDPPSKIRHTDLIVMAEERARFESVLELEKPPGTVQRRTYLHTIGVLTLAFLHLAQHDDEPSEKGTPLSACGTPEEPNYEQTYDRVIEIAGQHGYDTEDIRGLGSSTMRGWLKQAMKLLSQSQRQ